MKLKIIFVTALVSVLALGNVMGFTQKSSAAVEETSLASVLSVNEAFAEKTTKTEKTKTSVNHYSGAAEIKYGIGTAKVDISHTDSTSLKITTIDDGRTVKSDTTCTQSDSTFVGTPNN